MADKDSITTRVRMSMREWLTAASAKENEKTAKEKPAPVRRATRLDHRQRFEQPGVDVEARQELRQIQA